MASLVVTATTAYIIAGATADIIAGATTDIIAGAMAIRAMATAGAGEPARVFNSGGNHCQHFGDCFGLPIPAR